MRIITTHLSADFDAFAAAVCAVRLFPGSKVLFPGSQEAAVRRFLAESDLKYPDTKLKTHAEPTPYLGGLAVYLSFLMAFGLVFDFGPKVLGLLLAGSLVVLLGLLDDLGAITPKIKFFGQLVAAFVLVRSDIVIDLVYLENWQNVALTVFWIVGVMNAFTDFFE